MRIAEDATAAPGRAALYLRVSTGRQAEADLSIPDQRRQLLAFCAARGWETAIEFVEPGASGADDRRSELQRMLDMATAAGAVRCRGRPLCVEDEGCQTGRGPDTHSG